MQTLLEEWHEAKLLKITLEQFAKQKGETLSAIRSKIYRQGLKSKEEYKFDQPELYDWSLPKEWVFDWNDFMVIGDVQLPTTDYDFAMLPSMIAKKHLKKPRKLIIAGDFYNMDAFSKYVNVVPVPTWGMERDAAKNLLTIYSQTFEEIWMLCGNHERRILEKLNGELDINDVLAASLPRGKVKATVLDRCTVNTSQGKYTVVHGASYGKKSLNNADEYAQKYQSHIISHHEHHAALGRDRYDRYHIVNNGGLFDSSKMSYVQEKTSTMAGMSQGFTMVKNGYPYLFGKFTDWDRWL